MSRLDNRVRKLEGVLGNSDGPLGVFITVYEAREADFPEEKRAFVLWPDGTNETIEMRDSETSEEFSARLDAITKPLSESGRIEK